MDLARFPRRGYVATPTPLEFLPRLTAALGGPNIYIKRDDMLPGAAGGNKTRKLDFSFADALAHGATTIVTCGAIQSNHSRLTLSYAAKEGLPCHLVLEERVKGTFDANASGNNFLFKLLGVKSITVVPLGTNMLTVMESVAEKVRAAGGKPYIIPGGASNEVGATGYTVCAQEIMRQLYDQQLHIDHFVVPSGSAGTHAGLAVGLWGSNSQIPISGISVSRPQDKQLALVQGLCDKLCRRFDLKSLPAEKVQVYDDYVGGGYSRPTPGMIEAVKMLAELEGILLDPIYSGKCMAGLIDLVRKGKFKKGENVLFLATGGSPALFAYLDLFNPTFDIPVDNRL